MSPTDVNREEPVRPADSPQDAREETGLEAVPEAPSPGLEPGGKGTGSAGEANGLGAEVDSLKERLLRTQAEFENFRKRTRREREEIEERAAGRLVKDILPVLDSLDRALEQVPSDAEATSAAWRTGLELVARQLRDCLVREGVEEVPGAGAVFDPSIHEAVAAEPAQAGEGTRVIAVFQKGYLHRGRLVRPAQVKVTRPGGTAVAAADGEDGTGS